MALHQRIAALEAIIKDTEQALETNRTNTDHRIAVLEAIIKKGNNHPLESAQHRGCPRRGCVQSHNHLSRTESWSNYGRLDYRCCVGVDVRLRVLPVSR
jgi:hypothetical protein